MINKVTTIALLSSIILLAGCVTTDDTKVTNEAPKNTATEDEVFIDDYEDVIEIVDEDVYGKDITFVNRYPKSIRSYYESYEDETAVSYQTTDDTEEVRSYFNDQLTTDGWELSGESTDFMEYTKETAEGETEYVTIYLDTYKDQGIMEYEIVYEPPYTEDGFDSEDIDFEL
ncbi:MAG: hypothetical protein Q8P90_03605 [bacterium]|nr:hypothetical protein [bacterium]